MRRVEPIALRLSDAGIGQLACWLITEGRLEALGGGDVASLVLAVASRGAIATCDLANILGWPERTVRRHRRQAIQSGLLAESSSGTVVLAGTPATFARAAQESPPASASTSEATRSLDASAGHPGGHTTARPNMAARPPGGRPKMAAEGGLRPKMAAQPARAPYTRSGMDTYPAPSRSVPERRGAGFELSLDDIAAFPTVPGLSAIASRRVEPLPPGSFVDGSDVCRALPANICSDPFRLVVWWRQQIGLPRSRVTGDSGLELVLLVAKALSISRSAGIRNGAAVLVAALRNGRWRDDRECLGEAIRLVADYEAAGDVVWRRTDDGQSTRILRCAT